MIFIGRFFISSLFILGSINKILNYQQTLMSMSEVGLPITEVLLPLTILLELIGGVLVLMGKRFHIEASLVLAVFTLSTNFIFHNFWAMTEPQSSIELSLFFKNIVVVGALIFVAGIGLEQRNGRLQENRA